MMVDNVKCDKGPTFSSSSKLLIKPSNRRAAPQMFSHIWRVSLAESSKTNMFLFTFRNRPEGEFPKATCSGNEVIRIDGHLHMCAGHFAWSGSEVFNSESLKRGLLQMLPAELRLTLT